MKARALIYEGKLITVLNGEDFIENQIKKFATDNQNNILSYVDYYEGGTFEITDGEPFFEYNITFSGDNGIMIFNTIIYEI